jgi:hypothetical protein
MMNRRRTWTKALLVAGVFLGLLLTVGGLALANGYAVSSETVDGGGSTTGTGGDYTLRGSVGQQDASNQGSGGSYTLTGGFLNPDTGGPTVVTLAHFVARSAVETRFFRETWFLAALAAVGMVGGVLLRARRRRRARSSSTVVKYLSGGRKSWTASNRNA